MEDITKQSSPAKKIDEKPDASSVTKLDQVQSDLGLKHLIRFDIAQANKIALKTIADFTVKYCK